MVREETAVELHEVGRSGLHISELGLGAMTFGQSGWGCDEDTAGSIVHRFFDAGGDFIDTADCYGVSEEIVGRAVRGRRAEVVLGTKFGLPMGPGPNNRGTSRIHVRKSCEASLRRLQTDYIDLYQMHIDDPTTPLEETIGALDDLVQAGKVLYTGASNMRAYRLMKALGICDRHGRARFIAFQGQYNLIARSLEREHFQLFAEEGLGFLSWGPLASGMLTGKIKPQTTPDDTRLAQQRTIVDDLIINERGFQIAAVLQKEAEALGCSPAALALAWQRSQPVTSVIIGVRTMAQLEDNLSAVEVAIPPEVAARLEDASGIPEEYPGRFIDVFQGWLRRGASLYRR
jgi:aryl-alcohol dehydrogenase-like predicted oxidoreductase